MSDTPVIAYRLTGIGRRFAGVLAGVAILAATEGNVHGTNSPELRRGPELVAACASSSAARAVSAARLSTGTLAARQAALPLRSLDFVPNAGQNAADIRFSSRTARAAFLFSASDVELTFAGASERTTIRLEFLNANANAKPNGAGPRTSTVNYLVGKERNSWRTGLPTYGEVVYRDLWPGIDLAFHGDRGTLKYEFRLNPGADPGSIGLAYRGARGLKLSRNGDLLVQTALGTLRDTRPVSYQTIDGVQVPVASRYRLTDRGYKLALGPYDRSRPLVVDPGLEYSTFLGGGGSEQAIDIAVDSAGNAYVTGSIFSTLDFPTSPGAFDTTLGGTNDAFVTKFDPAGNLVYSTYLGGAGNDIGFGIAVDDAGSAYVVGSTFSPDFPTTAAAFDRSYGNGDVFIAKLNATGSALAYSTFLGGSGSEPSGALGATPYDIAVDATGSAYVTGITGSADFPVTPGAFDTSLNSQQDSFVAKLDPSGSTLVYATFLGGSGINWGLGIAADTLGNAYVTGLTTSANFPTTSGAFDTTYSASGQPDAFVVKLNATGSGLVYATYLGGQNTDQGNGIAVDCAGAAYVTGSTASFDFPTTAGAFGTTLRGGQDAFVTKLNPAGSGLVYSTLIGGTVGGVGTAFDTAAAIAVDAAGNAYIVGNTTAPDFPVTADAFDATYNGGTDAFFAKLKASGAALEYSTLFGGSGEDVAIGVGIDGAGHAYVSGVTASTTFPTTPGAFDSTLTGGRDAFVMKFATTPPGPLPAAIALTPLIAETPVGTTHTVTATVTDSNAQPSAQLTVRFAINGAVTGAASCVTDTTGRCSVTYQGPLLLGADAITAFADVDGSGTRSPCEPVAQAANTWVAVALPPSTIVVTPKDDIGTIATRQCLTATVTDALGHPVSDVSVRFIVTGSIETTGAAVTDATGHATFCYTGPSLPGADDITVHADTDRDGVVDDGEPVAAATRTWILPVATPGLITGGGRAPSGPGAEIAFGFNAHSGDDGTSGHCNVVDRARGVHLTCDTVTSLVRIDSHATIFGTATIDGITTVYRIDVDDLGEPGTRDTFRIVTSSGYSAGGTLTGGNIQVH